MILASGGVIGVPLGALLGRLGSVLGPLGAILGRLGAILGLSWAALKPSRPVFTPLMRFEEGPESQINGFHRFW